MADASNILKLMAALGGGGMASQDYSQGSVNGAGQAMKGGQPILPKPAISAPDLMSPYAPGNTGGGHWNNPNMDKRSGSDNNMKPSRMGNSPNHPAAQLAKYLATDQGVTRRVLGQVNSAAFLRGGASVPQ